MRKGHHVETAWINSPQADLVAGILPGKGHTVTEASIKFGVSRGQVNNLVKRRRITNGRNWRDGVQEANERRSLEAERRITEQLSMLGFDYVGGYTSKTGNVTIKCRACGDEFERTVVFVKRGQSNLQKCEHEKARWLGKQNGAKSARLILSGCAQRKKQGVNEKS